MRPSGSFRAKAGACCARGVKLVIGSWGTEADRIVTPQPTAGQVFRVGSSEILRDPGTGEVLDNSFAEMGKIRVDLVKEKISICTIVSGNGIEKGMAESP